MKKWLAALALMVSSHSFAHSQATAALLSMLNGSYHGYDCEVKVTPTNHGVSVEMSKDGQYMEYFVKAGSDFQYKPYGRFVSSYRITEGSVDYTEVAFFTTPANYGRYAAIEKRVVRNRDAKVTKIECIIVD